MIIQKKTVILNSQNNSNCSGILNIEKQDDTCFLYVKVLGDNGEFDMFAWINGKLISTKFYSFSKIKIDVSAITDIKAIILKNNEIIAKGSSLYSDDFDHNFLLPKKQETEIVDEEIEEIVKEEKQIEEEPVISQNIQEKTNKEIEEKQDKIETPKFFDGIKDKIYKMFEENEKDEELQSLIPNSKWVRIKCENDSYYVVGLIYEEGKEVLLCYGVYGNKDEENQNSIFFEIKDGEGYNMIYQNLETGELLKEGDFIK